MIDATMTAEDLAPPPYVHEEKTLWFRSPLGRTVDVSWLGAAKEAFARSPDTTALPGLVVTLEAVEHERERRALINLVNRFATEGFSWSGDHTYRPSEATREAARAFFSELPSGIALPKIAVDGEGAINAVWEDPQSPIIVVIDGWQLHMVAAAATPAARYFDDLAFVPGAIPNEVLTELAALP